MFEELNKLLRTESNPLEGLSFVHVEHSADGCGIANCSFLTHHFISYFLKRKFRVCLLTCSQTYSNYKVIQHKLGTNLENAITDGLFLAVPVLTNSLNPNESCNNETDSITSSTQNSMLYDPCSEILSQLEAKLKESHTFTAGKGPCLLIVDDLTALSDLGSKTGDILNLICNLKLKYAEIFTSILTTCSRFDSSLYPVELCSLSNQLHHWSDLTLQVDELSTGLSKDVHGQLTVRQRKSLHAPVPQCYHYKTTERDLKLFAVGASPAVL